MLKSLVLSAIVALTSGQNIDCVDTPGWVDQSGFDCNFYVGRGICSMGKLHKDGQYYAGKSYNFPTLNCCRCGKQDRIFFADQSFVPNRCTHKEENSKSEHVVEFCKSAQSERECIGRHQEYRHLHCQWNVNKYEMVFDDRHEENNDEDYVDEVSDKLAVWLKTPNAAIQPLDTIKFDKLETTKIGSASNCSQACLKNDACVSFDYSYNKKMPTFQDCVLYNISSQDTELLTGGQLSNVTDHYDLAIRPGDNTVQVLKILQRGDLDYELNEGGFDIGVLAIVLGVCVLVLIFFVVWKQTKSTDGKRSSKDQDFSGVITMQEGQGQHMELQDRDSNLPAMGSAVELDKEEQKVSTRSDQTPN